MDAVVDESVGVELDSVTVVNVHVVVAKVPDDMLDVMLIVCRCGAATNTRSGRTS